ncbi:PREDICTED: uncharacterized protein LOC106314764 [Brassica oleracea var. oleracea]|uniref:uncharacterized protein LOC106314764 n=1 Tax=Brassica oleracea var. oleracea TaxID=109376 RepID=UPI0006A6DEBE|nr:PREDICTED: uncharacterized protein LOC106314764 [Brassica oleracea var. oleracea]
MSTLETPNSETGANPPTTAPGGDASTREKAKDAQAYDVEDSDLEPEPDKETSDGAARTKSPMIAHLHQMFSDRLYAMQSMVAIPECSIPTSISAFKRGLLPDGDLYKELTKYQCKNMEDVLSRAWAQVKWEEDVASRAKAQKNLDPKAIRRDRTERDEKPSQRPARESKPGQVKWPQMMKAPDSFRNPSFWCDFHRDLGHKIEDCVALKIKFNELLWKGHLREFLSEKAKSHLRNETMAAKKSTWNAKHDLEAAKPKRLLLGADEISFTAKEQEKVLTPHHDALVISLNVANCLAAYKDLGLKEGALTRRINPLIGFSWEVKQTAGEVTLPVYAEGVNMSTKFLVVDCDSSYNMILEWPWIHGMGAVPLTLHQMSKPPARHTEEPEVEEMDEEPLTEGDQIRHLKISSKLTEGLRR